VITDELWPALSKRIREQMAHELEDIGSGKVGDHADYRERCGYLRGLRWVQDEAREIIKAMTGDK
jgi:hypothetical protein